MRCIKAYIKSTRQLIEKKNILYLGIGVATVIIAFIVGVSFYLAKHRDYPQKSGIVHDYEKLYHKRSKRLTAPLTEAGVNAKIAMITTYPPDQCGIATFSKNLIEGMKGVITRLGFDTTYQIHVINIQSRSPIRFVEDFDTDIVKHIMILDAKVQSKGVHEAVEFLIHNHYTHVILHGEYGLTPIMWQIVDLVRQIYRYLPIIYVWHSPYAHPTLEEREQSYYVSMYVDRIIVMSKYAFESAMYVYGIPEEKLVHIPHGILSHDVKHMSNERRKKRDLSSSEKNYVNLFRKRSPEEVIIFSNGFINRTKGHIRIIRAMPLILKAQPEVRVIIAGLTRTSGLLHKLRQEITLYDLESKVIIYDNFLSADLIDYSIHASDIYFTLYDEVTPVSGVLTHAMSLGACIVSTPFRYAVELMQNDNPEEMCGILVDEFDNPKMLADAFIKAIFDEKFRHKMGLNAKNAVKNYTWEKIASCYLSLISSKFKPYDELLKLIQYRPDPNPFTSLSSSWQGNTVTFYHNSKLSDSLTTSSEDLYNLLVRLNKKKDLIWDKILPWAKLETIKGFPTYPLEKSGLIINIYGDQDIIINGVVDTQFNLLVVGIRSRLGWFLMTKSGLDIELLDDESAMDSNNNDFIYDMVNHHLEIRSENIQRIILKLNYYDDEKDDNIEHDWYISLELSGLNRYSSPVGLLGKILQYKTDLFAKGKCDSSGLMNILQQSIIFNGLIFSSNTRDMELDVFQCIRSTLYKSFTYNCDVPRTYEPISHYNPDGKNLRKEYVPMWFVRENGYKVSDSQIPCVTMVMEGPFFDSQGLSTVNRHTWMSMQKLQLRPSILNKAADLMAERGDSINKLNPKLLYTRTLFTIKPICDSEKLPDPTRIIPLLIWENYQNPYMDLISNIQFDMDTSIPDFVYRNYWTSTGPCFTKVNDKTKLIIFLPWEFNALPIAWISQIKTNVSEIWTPSKSCFNGIVSNNIQPEMVKHIHHGVDIFKYIHTNPENHPPKVIRISPIEIEVSNEEKSIQKFLTRREASEENVRPMRLLYSGGLLARKGIDILYKAYISTFNRNSNVILIIHSSYGDGFYRSYLLDHISRYDKVTANPDLISRDPDLYDIPKIMLIEKKLDTQSVIGLRRLVDYYVAPYRAEGFGLITLEAMATGLPVVIPNVGPGAEFTTTKVAIYIKTRQPSVCNYYPCKHRSVVGLKTLIDPTWCVPTVKSVALILEWLYDSYVNNPKKSLAYVTGRSKENCIAEAAKYTWDKAGYISLYLLMEKIHRKSGDL